MVLRQYLKYNKAITESDLKARAFSDVLLEVQHCVQDPLVTAGNEAHGAEHLERRHLGRRVVGTQTLCYHADAGRMRQHVRPSFLHADQGCSPNKRSGGTPETRLRQRFLNNLGLHTRTLIHVRKIATADLWSRHAIQLLVFECL